MKFFEIAHQENSVNYFYYFNVGLFHNTDTIVSVILIYMAIIKQKEQRVAMFIDAQNLYHSARNLYGAKVNFGAVLKEAVAGRHLVRAIAYVITTEGEEERSFFDALNSLGIETKTKDLQIFFGGAKKADWDVGLAVDAIRLGAKVDAVVLASGDGDFVPLVEYLKFMGTQVEVITFGRSASGKLRDAADDFIDMCDDQHKYLLGFRGGNTSNGTRRPRKQATKPRKDLPKTE